jgi:hypothetical protein
MTTITGTHDISDLIAARFQSAASFGLDTIQQVLAADIAAHNQIVNEMVGEMCELSVDRQRIYGTSASGDMVEVDEYGAAPTQKARTGATVGFPLKLFQFNIGWTAKWMQTKTPADMAASTQAAEKAHLREIQRQIKKALYLSANYTHLDHLVDNVSLSVKRLLNADSSEIPEGPNGETYDGSTHSHYNFNATLTAAALEANINDVIEHGHGSSVKIAINKADESAVRALSGFVAYPDPRMIVPVYSATGVPAMKLDISRLDNRAIGVFAGAEVVVKPWAISLYPFAWDAGGSQKPLVYRQRDSAAIQGLRIASENDDYPLYSRFMEAEFGIGVWTRTNGAVLFTNNGGAYVDPTIS